MKIDGEKITFDNITISKDGSDPNTEALITVIASQKANPDTYVSFDIFEGDTGSFATTYFLFVIEGTEYFPGEGDATVTVNSNGVLKGNFQNLIQQWNTETESYDTLYTITEGSYDLKVN